MGLTLFLCRRFILFFVRCFFSFYQLIRLLCRKMSINIYICICKCEARVPDITSFFFALRCFAITFYGCGDGPRCRKNEQKNQKMLLIMWTRKFACLNTSKSGPACSAKNDERQYFKFTVLLSCV